MSQSSFRKACVSCVVGIGLFGGAVAANADWLSPNGDFGSNLNWSYNGGGFSRVAGAQSPFTNAYGKNDVGLDVQSSTTPQYVIEGFDLTTTTGLLYGNADFCNTTAGSGQYSLAIAYNSGEGIASFLRVSSDGVYINNETTSILTPTVGTWYNVQVTLDMTAKKYSGVITDGVASVMSSNKDFYQNAAGFSGVNSLFSDIRSGEGSPEHYIDNFGLSATPIPEPGMLPLLAVSLTGLLAYAWRNKK